MKNQKNMSSKHLMPDHCSKALNYWRKFSGYTMACGVLFAIVLMPLSTRAQTNMTIKPFQVRIEVPLGSGGTFYVNPCNLRIPTNGASATDITGTNWLIANVNVSVSGAPSGCTASLVDSGLVNPIGTIPVNLNTGNTAMNTNLIVKLAFDGTQASGTATLTITATGAGLPDDNFQLPLEVAKIWNGSANAAFNGAGSWSDGTQWLGTGAPGPNDNVVFTDVGTQTNSLLNGTYFLTNCDIPSSTVISSLRFSQTNGTGSIKTNWQNLYINDGVTLAISGNDGFSLLRDYTYWSLGLMNVSIFGTNGTLIQTNENASFSILSDAQEQSLLDMSELGNLQLDVNRLYLSDYQGYPNYSNLVYTNGYTSTTAGAGKPQKFYQTWKMAVTNYVKAAYVDPFNYTNALSRNYALTLGRNDGSGGGSGPKVETYMGHYNVFNLDGICIGGPSCYGADFQFLNTNSYAIFRNADGVSRMSMFATADLGGQSTDAGDKSKCGGNGPGVDFTKGYVDMLVDRLYLSLDGTNATGGYSQTSGFYVGAGIIDANTAILGYQSQGNTTNAGTCYANVYITNTAVLKVNDTLALGYTTAAIPSPTAASYGVLNIGPGGTVMANNITVGGPAKTSAGNKINLNGNASLIVSNGIADATPNGALGTLSLSGGNNSLTLFINGSNPPAPFVYVTNLIASGTENELIIGGVTNISTFPAYIPLIAGVGPAISASVFDAGVVMPPGMHGTLVNSSSNTINLIILNRTPNNLVWRGTPDGSGTASWDYTTKNWLDQSSGLMTNYNDPDIVSFDDTPGYATNINLAVGPLLPAAIYMTNNSLYYTILNGANQIIGGPVLNKQGTGTLEIDANTTCSVDLNQGTLVGLSTGSIGNASIAAGAVMNFGGSLGGNLVCSGIATSSGSVAGTLTVLGGGVVTNSGTVANSISVKSGGFLYNSGTLSAPGSGSSGSPQIASGGVLINSGAIGQNLGDNILYVLGTFEDLGGVSDNLTLQSVTVGAGGAFIPGGDGIGSTTINSDGTGTFPGAALFVQGSTNVFKVDPTIPENTVLVTSSLSFGGSSSQRTQNGCTLAIENVSLSPFAAGESFPLFSTFGSTGTSTNTYPVITPATPGAGLAWDLTKLWVNGSIGVVAANSGPALTNGFTVGLSGTNIVGQFSWDPSDLGYSLETQVNPLTVGLSSNWIRVNTSWTQTSVTITNVISTNCVFYRLSFP
jgi:hypothetical protein